MIPEAKRFDWQKLDTSIGPSAIEVPLLINTLLNAEDEAAAEDAYRVLSDRVLNQRSLFGATIPAAYCLLSCLYDCSSLVRPLVLLILSDIGYAHAPNEQMKAESRKVICSGLSHYVYLLEGAVGEELTACLDLVAFCADKDESVKPRLLWVVKEYFSGDHISDANKAHARLVLDDYGIPHPD